MAVGPDILSVQHLQVRYVGRRNWLFGKRDTVSAVEDVSFDVGAGETFGLVGESGCGKSSIARALLRLQEPSGGQVVFDGVDIIGLSKEELRRFRKRMQMIFQDSYSSLNPYMTVAEIIAEPLEIFAIETRRWRRERADALLESVGLSPQVGARYPHEFSGGQRQRINIARALALDPSLIVCDEPVSSLDVSIQGQIIELLENLQDRLGLTYIFISHDLAVVREICHRVAIMYLGRICELASSNQIYEEPLHPYTKALLSAVPIPDPEIETLRENQRITLHGDVADATHPPAGCRFSSRCPMAKEVARKVGIDCHTTPPALAEVTSGHLAACHLFPECRPQGHPV